MELVYLWVKKYKNIEKQGFNFSPRFECKYDEKSEKLTIDEKKDYVSIFPDNINITAIVGENGSGKTNLINKILYDIDNYRESDNTPKELYCFYHKKVFYINSYIIKQKSQIKKNLSDFNIVFSHKINLDNMRSRDETYEDIYDKSFFYNYNNFLEKDKVSDIQYEYNENMLSYSEVNKSNNIINIEQESYKYTTYLMSLLLNQDRIPKNIKNFFVPVGLYLERVIYIKNNNIKEADVHNNFLELNRRELNNCLKLETLIYLRHFVNKYTIKDFDEELNTIKKLFKESDIMSSYNDIHNKVKRIANRYISSIKSKKSRFRERMLSDDSGLKELNEFEKILTFIEKDYELNIEVSVDNSINEPCYKVENINNLNEHDLQRLKDELPNYLRMGFINDKGTSFNELSSGEQNLLKLLFSIENIIQKRKDKSDSLFIMLDEIENAFHPQWQKSILNWVIEFVRHYEKIQINIIIASHSPFIISDLPQENIIFLTKYKKDEDKDQKEGNCKIATKDININPFGANIHTLLSDGFFMSDGLMGEFAKGRIEEIKKFYDFIQKFKSKIEVNNKIKDRVKKYYLNKKDKFEHIQSIIGEPFLQTIMKNYLDELEIYFNGKNKFLDKEIKRLQALKDK